MFRFITTFVANDAAKTQVKVEVGKEEGDGKGRKEKTILLPANAQPPSPIRYTAGSLNSRKLKSGGGAHFSLPH